uniref:Queuine tRNA-ribosyltransferase subunit qtrtd1 n=1 Tax=Cacopsylla melanoneura TaxID=428564 RepID=A0A8D8YGL0_9HEMI
MKFTVTRKHVSHMGRLGILSEFSRMPASQIETPIFMLYARGGVITHLTHETLQQVNTDSAILQIPFPSISIMKDAVQQSNQQSLSNFIGMKEYPSFVCLHDPFNLALQKSKRKMEVAIKGRRGNEDHSAEKFMSSIESLVPDMYQVLTQLEFTNKPKRMQVNVDRSIQFLDNCLSLHKNSEVLKKTSVIAAVQGGNNLSLRKECAVQCATRDVHGFLIDGLCSEEEATEDVDSDFVKAVLENTVKLFIQSSVQHKRNSHPYQRR